MLARSLQLLPGIRERRERRLWNAGVRSWRDARAHRPTRVEARTFDRAVADCERAWSARDAGWFSRTLPSRESWRVYREFAEHAAYLDIETTGSSRTESAITCVAVATRRGVRTFVADRNLEIFPEAIRDASILVTFNGAGFDLPFLRAAFPKIDFEAHAHFDLCHAFRRLGHAGGLKRIEREMGVPRDDGLDGVDGTLAIDFWQRHVGGDPRACATLERYCAEDVLGLPALAAMAANALLVQTPFAGELAPLAVPRRIESYLPYSRDLVADCLARRAAAASALRPRVEPREEQLEG